jgi:acetyl esterase/lipase
MKPIHKTLISLAVCTAALAPLDDRAQTPAAESPVVYRNVVYSQRDGEELLCDIYVPRGDGPFPAVLCVHGGAWRIGNKEQMTRASRMLAERGYVAVSINYRLAPDHHFPAQLEDCRDAVLWMQRRANDYRIDPQTIAGLGYSAGAHLVTLLAMTGGDLPAQPTEDSAVRDPVRLRAVVAGGTPTDFRNVPEVSRVLAYWLGGTRRELPELYRAASPAHFVAADIPPIFFFHGERDLLVPPDGVETMVKQLEQAGAVAELRILPGAGHIEAFFDDDAYRQGIDFLDKHVRRQQPDPPAAEASD